MSNDGGFTFEISLSVLNHLGRNLYRSFLTVLGEAISNSWDADAQNVWIYVNRDKNTLVIKDDGIGMNEDDFQNKFLKVGYSKRKEGETHSDGNRPYIGRKGIGKLALLSCAQTISVISKTAENDYVGGVIDNSELDEAIQNDLTPDKYPLENWDRDLFEQYLDGHERGTIIFFDQINEGIRNTIEHLQRMLALYFRFSLIDENFNIHLNDELITIDHLDNLAEKTQFVWLINELDDPFVIDKLTNPPLLEIGSVFTLDENVKGFIASVKKPRDLKVISTDERVSIDLFVNGRLRERDILKHMPTSRIAENYFYGQIHYDELDDEKDRFTSSREGLIADDPKFKSLLELLRSQVILKINEEWDELRIKHREDGDPENKRITKRERKSRELYNAISDEYIPSDDSENKDKVESWINELGDDAQFNFSAYADCYISENLIRKYIKDQDIELSPEALSDIKDYRERENQHKGRGNISIEIRKDDDDLFYLSMDSLANLVDKVDENIEAGLSRNAFEYRPIRNALAHTSRLTDAAKRKLTSVYENIKARVKTLLE